MRIAFQWPVGRTRPELSGRKISSANGRSLEPVLRSRAGEGEFSDEAAQSNRGHDITTNLPLSIRKAGLARALADGRTPPDSWFVLFQPRGGGYPRSDAVRGLQNSCPQ
jgi:hypothetical protein